MDLPDELGALALDQSRISRKSGRSEPSIAMDSVKIVGGCSQLSLPDGVVASAVVCLSIPGLNRLCGSFAMVRTDAEYKPTYLAYREGPALVKALSLLPAAPDVLLVPAAGIDHPRRLGMARHIGYLLSIPTVGVTRAPLVCQDVAGRSRGAERTCVAFRLGPGRAPVYVSHGWGIDTRTSVEIVRTCTKDHRMPEPIHQAKGLCRERTSLVASTQAGA